MENFNTTCFTLKMVKNGVKDVCSSFKEISLSNNIITVANCLQYTIAVWIAFVFIMLAGFCHLLSAFSRKRNNSNPWTWLNVSKLVLSVFINVIIIFSYIGVDRFNHSEEYTAAVLMLAASCFLSVIILVDQKMGIVTSGYIYLSWVVLAICSIIRYVYAIIAAKDGCARNEEICFIILFNLVLVEIILHSFADKQIKDERKNKVIVKDSPTENCSFLNQIFFTFFWQLALTGYKRNIVRDDLWDISKANSSQYLLSKWQKHFFTKKTSNSSDKKIYRSILVTSILCFKDILIMAIVLNAVAVTLQFVGPQILKYLLTFIQDMTKPLWLGLSATFFMLACDTVQMFCQQQQMYKMFMIAFRLKSVLLSSIYFKCLRMSEQNSGKLISHVTSDVQRIINIISRIQMIWTSPLQIILALYFLWKTLGWSTLVGFCVMILFIPINFYLARLEQKYEISLTAQRDMRMKALSELLNGIKVIKLNAWEISFQTKINEIRKKELQFLKMVNIVQAANSLMACFAPLLVAVISFTTFVYSDTKNILTPQIAFVSLALFNLLRQPLNDFPPLLSGLIQANISRKRLEEFFSKEELNRSFEATNDLNESIAVRNASFKYDQNSSNNFSLANVNLTIKPGHFVVVVGQVGSGKSSLLLALLREMYKLQGSVNVTGTVAYVPQEAWIRNATVKENIIFTKDFDSEQYENIIKACALEQDLALLPNKDETEIGEKGVNLSGGQKQRISLARSVYQNCDIYLLDDPLSAVDVHVGRHLFDNVIIGLLQNKTRIFVTHNRSYLKHADLIVIINNGQLISGTLEELRKTGDYTFLEKLVTDSDKIQSEEECQNLEEPVQPTNETNIANDSIKTVDKSIKFISAKKEKIESGKVSWQVYNDYLKAVGVLTSVGLMCLFALSTSFGIASNLWLAKWTNDNSLKNATLVSTTTGLSVYFSFGLLEGLIIFVAVSLTAYAMIKSSNILHSNILYKVLRSPLSFFEVTPIGVILNRFGADFENVDGALPFCIQNMVASLLKVISTVVIIIISSPIFVIVIIVLMVFFYFVQKFYISTARQLKRIMSASNSPVLSFLSETVSGAVSIRAYKSEQWYMNEFFRRVDYSQIAWYPVIVSNRWLGFYLQLIGNFIVFSAALIAVIMREHTADAGLLGLAITCALSVTYSLVYMVRCISEIETNIVSVERIKEYIELPSEADWKSNIPLSDAWPSEGKIQFNDYSTRYRPDLDLSLKNISFLIPSCQKVGIVGRTGAGKSSLALSLFRIIESVNGRILIDDIDISTVGLHDLRSRMAIIPQDPVIFSGTLRSNIDPTNQHTDKELWQVLQYTGLSDYVSQLPDSLSYIICESGSNFSVGQRQLICLARALLKNSKILLLDEATSAVDVETEKLILESIAHHSEHCTVLTIAHRINTIMSSDCVMVLSDGGLLEHGKTNELLLNESSRFYAMANDSC